MQSDVSKSKSKAKKRKYSPDYLNYGFTSISTNGEEKAQCVVCMTVLGNDSLRPQKLKDHLEKKHPNHKSNDLAHFQTLLRSVKAARLDNTELFVQKQESALMASYLVAQRIAKAKKPHTIGENLIAPCIEIVVKNMIGEEAAKKVKQVSLSNNTVHRRIEDMSANIEEQVVAEVMNSSMFSIQLDESVDIEDKAQLIAFVRYLKDHELKTEFLFCKPLETTCGGEDIFNEVDAYFKVNNIKWENLCFCTTDGAKSMMGKSAGLRGRIKNVNLNCQSIHCCLHRQVLSSKYLPEELQTVFNTLVKIINAIKSSSTNCRLFAKLCDDNNAEHNKLHYYTAVRWLSKGNSFNRVFELREEVYQFLDMKNSQLSSHMKNDTFLAVLAYFCDIFGTLNKTNKMLQGSGTYLFGAADKLKALTEILDLWTRQVQKKQFSQFKNLQQFLNERNINCEFDSEILSHLTKLNEEIDVWFKTDIEVLEKKQWIPFPFSAKSLESISDDASDMKEELINLRNSSVLKEEFQESDLATFWSKHQLEFPLLSKEAFPLLLAFPTSWECEAGFSQISILKTKHRNRLKVENDARLALSKTEPQLQKLVKRKQAHRSH